MDPLLILLLATLLAGLAMPLGALVASFENIRTPSIAAEWHHLVMAFGGGALLSAVALVLVPEGMQVLSTLWVASLFLGGGLFFMTFDILLSKKQTQASQLVAMLFDFIPESIALGAAFAIGSETGLLLAIMIGMQNLPEGFNAYSELIAKNRKNAIKIIFIFTAMAMLGPVAGLVGFYWLANLPEITAGVMLFAAGGILYSVFQDIAPQVKLNNHFFPPMGAVLGFFLGMLGLMLTH